MRVAPNGQSQNVCVGLVDESQQAIAPAAAARVLLPTQRNAGIHEWNITDLLPTACPGTTSREQVAFVQSAVVLAELEATGETRLLAHADQPGRAVVGLLPRPFGIGRAALHQRPRVHRRGRRVAGQRSGRVDRTLLATAAATALAHRIAHSRSRRAAGQRFEARDRRESSLPSRASTTSRDASGRLSRLPSAFFQHDPRSHCEAFRTRFRARVGALEPAVEDVGLVAGELRRRAEQHHQRAARGDRAIDRRLDAMAPLELQPGARRRPARRRSTASATGAPPASPASPSAPRLPRDEDDDPGRARATVPPMPSAIAAMFAFFPAVSTAGSNVFGAVVLESFVS